MGNYIRDLCDITIELKNQKKHLNTRVHSDFSTSFVKRYFIKNPAFLEIEIMLKSTFMIILKGLNFTLLYVNGNWILITLSSV